VRVALPTQARICQHRQRDSNAQLHDYQRTFGELNFVRLFCATGGFLWLPHAIGGGSDRVTDAPDAANRCGTWRRVAISERTSGPIRRDQRLQLTSYVPALSFRHILNKLKSWAVILEGTAFAKFDLE